MVGGICPISSRTLGTFKTLTQKGTGMNWLGYFEQNRDHRLKIPWERSIDVDGPLRRPLIRSLQRFQVGESGEGGHLRRRAATTGDPVYQASIDLFIKEEQEHARLMAQVLQRLHAPLLHRHWTDSWFVALRHAFGLHGTLLVLLLPEMIAKRYFRALKEGTSNPVLSAVFQQIYLDEEGHLAFHADFLNHACSGLPFARRLLVQVAWRLVFRIVCAVVILDHGDLLRAVGVSPRTFWRDCGQIFDEVAAVIFSPASVLCSPKSLMPAQ